MSWLELEGRTGLTLKAVTAALKQSGLVLLEEQQWAIDKPAFQAAQDKLKAMLAAFHKANPLQPGMSKEDLRSRELAHAPSFLLEALLKATPGIAAQGELLRLSSHKVAFQADEEQALKKIEDAFATAGLSVPGAQEVLKSCGVDAVRARNLLQILLRDKRLIKVADDLLFHGPALAAMRGMLAEKKGSRFGVAEFKDWTGVSRKYAIPLLEYLDRERVTRREGDARVIL
jgi:selenocysteine-specific elongation factor